MTGEADGARIAGPPADPGLLRWALTAPSDEHDDLVAVGADLDAATILHAYSRGLFPMGIGDAGGPPLGWWSPVERGVLLPGDFHASRSLRRHSGRFTVTVDTAFAEVVAGCADPGREGRWITPEITDAYTHLHELGWAHSVEVWGGADRATLVGGLYGLALGGLFAGESMFHRETDASKVAVWSLAERWFADGDSRRIVDVQWQTPHLARLGVRQIPRAEYLGRLAAALRVPWSGHQLDTPATSSTPPEQQA